MWLCIHPAALSRCIIPKPLLCMHLMPQVYEAVFATYTRDFKVAAGLFLEALATFTA